MKAALLKEFYVWRKNGIFLFLILIVECGAAITMGAFSVVMLGLTVGMPVRLFVEDEKNCWNDYSRTLPYSTVDRVSARFIIVLAEILCIFSLQTAASISSVVQADNRIVSSLAEYFPYLDLKHASVVTLVLSISVFLAGLSFSFPLYYLIKGQKKTVLGGIPLLVAFFLVFVLNLNTQLSTIFVRNSVLMKTMYYEKWVMAVIASIAVLSLALSWIVSIIINTNSSEKDLKKFKSAAAVLTAVIVAASAVSVFILYKNGRFKKDETDYTKYMYNNSTGKVDYAKPEDAKDPTKTQLECRENITSLIETFFIKQHVDMPIEECKKELEELGYTETEYGSGKFYLGDPEDDMVTVELSRYENSDGVKQVYIEASVGTYYIEKATTDDLEKISSNFSEGMTEQVMLEKFKELNIITPYVRQYIHPDFGLTNYYYIEYKVLEYNGGKPTNYSLHFDVINGVVDDLRIYDY